MLSLIRQDFKVESNDLINAGYASLFIKRKLKELDIPRNIIRSVGIATYEAEINMAIHSYGGTVDITLFNNVLTIVFKDRGPGIPDIELAKQKGYSTASNFARENGFGAGLGLYNIEQASDEFYLTSSKEGTILTVKFYFNEEMLG